MSYIEEARLKVHPEMSLDMQEEVATFSRTFDSKLVNIPAFGSPPYKIGEAFINPMEAHSLLLPGEDAVALNSYAHTHVTLTAINQDGRRFKTVQLDLVPIRLTFAPSRFFTLALHEGSLPQMLVGRKAEELKAIDVSVGHVKAFHSILKTSSGYKEKQRNADESSRWYSWGDSWRTPRKD